MTAKVMIFSDQQLEQIEQIVDDRCMVATKKILTTSEVARYMGVSKTKIYNLTRRRLIPFYKQGAFNYFVREDIEKWLLRNRIASAEELDRQAAAYVMTGKADAGRRARTPRVKAGKGGER